MHERDSKLAVILRLVYLPLKFSVAVAQPVDATIEPPST